MRVIDRDAGGRLRAASSRSRGGRGEEPVNGAAAPPMSPARQEAVNCFTRIVPIRSSEAYRHNVMHTLGTAAKASGVSKSAIYRAIKAGRLSATRADSGDYRIDPAELFRWRDSFVPAKQSEAPPAQPETAALQAEIAGLKQVADLMRTQLDDVRSDRDHWRLQAERLGMALPKPDAQALPAERRRWQWWRRAG